MVAGRTRSPGRIRLYLQVGLLRNTKRNHRGAPQTFDISLHMRVKERDHPPVRIGSTETHTVKANVESTSGASCVLL